MQVGRYVEDYSWLDCLELSGTGISEPDLLKLTRGNFKRRVPLRSWIESTSKSHSYEHYLQQSSLHQKKMIMTKRSLPGASIYNCHDR